MQKHLPVTALWSSKPIPHAVYDMTRPEGTALQHNPLMTHPDLKLILEAMGRDFYILNEKNEAVPATVDEWGQMFGSRNRIVAQDYVAIVDSGVVWVSTTFLGMDHNWNSSGPPLLFETMIFGGRHDQYQERYTTWEEAEVGS